MNALFLAQIAHPDPLPQPAPAWLFWFLLVLTFFLHVLAMNVLLGGSIIGVVTRISGGSRGPAGRLVDTLTAALPTFVAATITLGVAPLLFVQVLYGRVLFSSSILMGWWWLGVIPLLLVGYYGVYMLAMRREKLGAAAKPLALISTLAFLTIAFIYVNNMSLMLRAPEFLDRYSESGAGSALNLGDPTFLPRFLHFLLGAIAIAGLFVALIGLVKRARDPELGLFAMKRGAAWFAIATLINVLVGFWWLVALPRETMLRFMGQDPLATGALALGVLGGLTALGLMFMAISAADPARLVKGGLHATLLTLVAMILTRDQVRRGALETMEFSTNPWVSSQWGPIVLFAILLVAALVAVALMVRMLLVAQQRTS